jgi:Flp pilus assembly protein TadB
MNQGVFTGLIIGGAILIVGFGYIYMSQSGNVSRDYVNALGVCAQDAQAGAAMLSALERAHGEAPDEFRLDASMCQLEASTDRLRELSGN